MLKAGDTVSDAEVWLGNAPVVPLVVQSNVVVTLPRKARHGMKVTVSYDGPIPAPIAKGTPIAKLVVSAPDIQPIQIPLVAGADVGTLGFTGRITAALEHVIWGQTK